MVFSSLPFIFIFLPIFLVIYYFAPLYLKNFVILLGSLAFYTVGAIKQPWYILLFLVSIVINFRIGDYIAKEELQEEKKKLLTAGLIFDLGWLFLFKYADFILSIVYDLIGLVKPEVQVDARLNFVLPLGISFYTFQMISYLVDVYRKKVKAEKSIIKFAVYISMFPQLIAGPIVRYSTVRDQLYKKRKCTFRHLTSGLKVFILGLGIKVLIANQMGTLWSSIGAIGYESISTKLAWLGIFAFSFQIYFDFWGYSLMAIGLGKMMNIQLPENFRQPYMSVSVTEFWRRWHVTLGSWFREYLYIPLGGNRTSKPKWIRNLFIVWVLTGFWHGAGWNFILWGFVLFLLILIEKLGLLKILEKYRVVGHLYLIFVIPLTWAIFAITNLSDLAVYFSRLFPFFTTAQNVIFSGDYLKYLGEFKYVLVAAIIFSTPLPMKLLMKIRNHWLGYLIYMAIFWASVYCLYIGMNDPFLYFRF